MGSVEETTSRTALSEGEDKVHGTETPKEAAQEEDWGLSFDFHLFAKHERHKIYVNEQQDFFWVECVEALTPLDMMNLSGGIHDATGNCVWTGAFLFVAALPLLAAPYLNNKAVFELGSGTGIASLALLTRKCGSDVGITTVCMTDADPEALRLCQRNCSINEISESRYQIRQHFWGTKDLAGFDNDKETVTTATSTTGSFDTVIAADILYDIGMLNAIFQSAEWVLSSNNNRTSGDRHFVLSHVPRACYNEHQRPSDLGSTLEDSIINEAKTRGFTLSSILRPLDIIAANYGKDPTRTFPDDALNDTSLDEMAEMEAAIFIFQKVLEK